jgi:hypothetical protein
MNDVKIYELKFVQLKQQPFSEFFRPSRCISGDKNQVYAGLKNTLVL